MAKKGRKSGGQAARTRQQQEAAARRRGVRPAGVRDLAASPVTAVPPGTAAAAAPARGADRRPRHYLDVSAVRIQEWLARTPDLKFRRGASVLLTEATAREEAEKDLPAGMTWNDEAGDVDGVVSLVLSDDDPEPEVRLRKAAGQVAQRMRAKMPHINIQAVVGRGETYAEAYEEMAKARRDGRFLLDLPPAPQEMITAKPCDQCRSAAAAVHPDDLVIVGEKCPDLCGECYERFLAASGTKGDKRSPLPERRMKKALEAAGMNVAGFSDHFLAMAKAGRTRGDDASSQLALIYADGNRVGAFLHEAVGHAGSRTGIDKSEIVHVIDEATIRALADAVRGRFPGWPRPPVLAHIAGGDDLLVSVPAADGWLFTRMLLASFGTRIGKASQGWPEPVRKACPSLSAGLVFSHLMHPFSDLVRVAGQELRKAKAAGHGEQAMVSFLDLTADGGDAPQGRTPLPLAYLKEHANELERIEAIPPSRRQALLALIRQGATDDLIRRVTDFADNQPLWDVIAGPEATPELARKELDSEAARDELRRLLDIARHWTTGPRPEEAP